MDAHRVYIQSLQIARQSKLEALRLEADLLDIVDRIRDSERAIEESRKLAESVRISGRTEQSKAS